jgi:hypothetical protein
MSARLEFPTILAILMSLGTCTTPKAFEQPTHEKITKDSLSQARLTAFSAQSPTTWEFQSSARTTIAGANSKVDDRSLGGTVPGTAHYHFDDSLLNKGAQRLIELRGNIMTKLKAAEDIMSGLGSSSNREADFKKTIKEAHEYLGKAHHGIQDFYAHSNWIEAKGRTIAELVWLGNTTNPFQEGIVSQCDALCGTTPVPNTGIFSGEFRFPEDRMLLLVRNNPGRCVHGPGNPIVSEFEVIFPPAQCGPVLKGLAKDKPGDTSSDNQKFSDAVEMATRASAAYTQGILLEARTKSYFVALCGFLGYADRGPCLAKQTETKEFILPFYVFSGPGNYKTDEVFTWDVPKFDATKGQIRSIATKWEWEVTGPASCPADPGSVIGGANICLALRRIGALAVSSPDMNVGALYCNTWPDLLTSTCGLNTVMPDTFGFGYITWPGGDYQVKLDKDFKPPTELRYISNNLGSYEATSAGQTFRLDGTFVSRLLFNLGVYNGPGLEPSTYTGSGAYLSFDGQMKIRITINYEYVPDNGTIVVP